MDSVKNKMAMKDGGKKATGWCREHSRSTDAYNCKQLPSHYLTQRKKRMYLNLIQYDFYDF